jgi:hypothetical protein
MRAFRGLILVFALSFVNFVGLMLTVTMFGGLGEWTRWQFAGMFGLIEAASGLASVIAPNAWRLPVAESRVRTDVRLTPSTLFIPHWAALARTAAGGVLMAAAVYNTGVSPATASLLPLTCLVAVIVVATSVAVARWGVAQPQYDVMQVVVRFPGREHEMEPFSLSAASLQLLLSIMTIPAVKLLRPDVLYRPDMAASPEALLAAGAVAAVAAGAAIAAWWGRMEWRAPREQQREAERFA